MESIKVSKQTKLVLGLQHVFAMFGATVLVPYLTGLNPSIALLGSGIGTLIFHMCTKKIVPVYLGSSFAFIGALSLVLKENGISSVKGGVIVAGIIYMCMAYIVKVYGVEKVKSFFPPIVTGPIIMVIGLRLSPTALSMAGYSQGTFELKSLFIASIVIITMIIISVLEKSFFRLVPILISITVGYLIAIPVGMVDFTPIINAPWIGFTAEAWRDLVSLPSFSLDGILAIAPIALVVFIEHIGDITTNGAVVGKDFFANPGIARTLVGDGLATVVGGIIGAPPNTTYGENTGVLAITKVYDPSVLRVAALYAIGLSVLGKMGMLLQTIPVPVMGGVSVILFGMIAAVGVRTLIDADLNFTHSRNLVIAAVIFVFGIAVDNIVVWRTVSLSGLTIAAIIGIILNKILPKDI